MISLILTTHLWGSMGWGQYESINPISETKTQTCREGRRLHQGYRGKKNQVDSHSLIIGNPLRRGCLSPSCFDVLFKALGPVLPRHGMWLYKIYWGHFPWVDLTDSPWGEGHQLLAYISDVLCVYFNNICRINLLKCFGQFKNRKTYIWQNKVPPLGISHWVFGFKWEAVTLLNSSALGPLCARSIWK